MKQPNIKKGPEIERFLKLGFDRTQATSLAWAEIFEERMAEIEAKYQGRVDGTIRIDCHCHDCGKGGQFLPHNARHFIYDHKGHKTKTLRLK